MTKWQLPKGVEYPIAIFIIQAEWGGVTRTTTFKYKDGSPFDDETDLLYRLSYDRFNTADSIRINNSIDLVKIEE